MINFFLFCLSLTSYFTFLLFWELHLYFFHCSDEYCFENGILRNFTKWRKKIHEKTYNKFFLKELTMSWELNLYGFLDIYKSIYSGYSDNKTTRMKIALFNNYSLELSTSSNALQSLIISLKTLQKLRNAEKTVHP